MKKRHVGISVTCMFVVFLFVQEFMQNGIVLGTSISFATSLIDPWTVYEIVSNCNSALCEPDETNTFSVACHRFTAAVSTDGEPSIPEEGLRDHSMFVTSHCSFTPPPPLKLISSMCRFLTPRCLGRCIEVGYIDALSKARNIAEGQTCPRH